MSYGKFFSSTFTGSMMGAGSDIFAIWGYVIAHTIQGQVELNPKLLSAVIGMPEDRVIAAIEYLMSPDESSRNPDCDGARLVQEGRFAYRVVSHFIYRAMKDEDERREYNREKQRESRARKPVKNVKAVKDCQSGQETSRQAEAEAEAEALLSIELPSGNSHPVPRGFVPTETQLKINAMFGRRNSTAWTDAENRALRKLRIDDDDLRILGLYYGADIATDKDIRRRDIKTLLNNWPGEVDRARTFLAANPSVDPTAPRISREF